MAFLAVGEGSGGGVAKKKRGWLKLDNALTNSATAAAVLLPFVQ